MNALLLAMSTAGMILLSPGPTASENSAATAGCCCTSCSCKDCTCGKSCGDCCGGGCSVKVEQAQKAESAGCCSTVSGCE